MLPKVAIGRSTSSTQTNLENYRMLVGDEMIDELLSLAHDLRKIRICHINSTAYGGGVAELLSRYLPFLQGLGVSAEWRLIHGTRRFSL
jgi:trehalose synthase